ncbi:hypothetical protein EV05_1144 [Prochlorococcus sp. MIT 0601]|nr:hypothetical protein EV05_1144 [Prochlorococcus sp. MIT 0601]
MGLELRFEFGSAISASKYYENIKNLALCIKSLVKIVDMNISRTVL